MKQSGILLLVIGLALTIFTTATFFTKENIVEIGALKITNDEPHTMNWSPFAGLAVMGIGGVLLWQAAKKQQSY